MSFTLGPDLLFVPADRPERYEKAAGRASAVIVDLEDAVLPAARPAARTALETSTLDPSTTIVRINARGTADHEADLAALRRTQYRWVMVPKAASAQDVEVLDAAGSPYEVLALIETALGVASVEAVAAHPQVVALMWGAEDLVASMDGTSSRNHEGAYRDVARFARARTLIAAKAFGKAAIDAVYLNIRDVDGLHVEARDAVASGFDAKAVLHPDQALAVRDAYRPTPEQVAWAEEVLNAALAANGAFSVRGEMVDEVVLKLARRTLLRSQG